MTRILIVEDSPTQAEYLRQILDTEGAEIAVAGDAALALGEMAKRRFDLVLTDVTMPGVLDGVGLLKTLRADPATAAMPIIVLSARADEEARVAGLAAGADDYIAKPFSPRELLARVDGAVRLARLRLEIASHEQALEIARTRVKLALAMDAAKMGEVVFDRRTGALVHTPGYAALLGYPADKTLTPADIRERYHPDDRADLLATETARRSGGEFFEVEHRIVWPDGAERWLAGRGRVARDLSGEPAEIVSVYMDVTDKKNAQARIDGLQAEVAHVGRLSELGRMSSVIAHELNQPLTAALNFLAASEQIAAADPPQADRLRVLVGKASAQVMRAGEILTRIRGFAARGDAARAPTDLATLIGEVVEIARLDPRHRAVDLRIDLPEDLPAPVADRVQVQQVLLNLLRNAFEAVQACATKRVAVSVALTAPDELEVQVADSGPGLAPKVAARLFEPFVTTKADGMGVGLSVCRDLVEAHQGRMWAEPKGDLGGAVFHFTLPLRTREPPSGPERLAQTGDR